MSNHTPKLFNYPHTISNGHGETLTFLRRGNENGIDYLEVENLVMPGGGPPMHTHYQQDECLTIIEGKMGTQIAGQDPLILDQGGIAHFRAGVAHRFWNAGETPLRCRGRIWPADNIEYFLTAIFRSTAASRNGRPASFDAAYLLQRYASEFSMDGIPTIVRRVIFPLVLATGKARGMHKKFADAPPAISKRTKVNVL